MGQIIDDSWLARSKMSAQLAQSVSDDATTRTKDNKTTPEQMDKMQQYDELLRKSEHKSFFKNLAAFRARLNEKIDIFEMSFKLKTSRLRDKDKKLDVTQQIKQQQQLDEAANHQQSICGDDDRVSPGEAAGRYQKRHRRTTSTSSASTTSNPLFLLTIVFLVASAHLVSNLTSFGLCDSQSSSNSSSASSLMIQQQQAIEQQHNHLTSSSLSSRQQPKRYRDKLITYLTDEIERKHFSLTKSGRPSKFDSGQEIDFISFTSPGESASNSKGSKSGVYENSIVQQHYATTGSNKNNYMKHQADSTAMSDIMRMHELAASNQANNNQKQPVSLSSKRSRAIGPVKLMASMISGTSTNQDSLATSSSNHQASSTPALSHLLNTYISPYILGMGKFSQLADASTVDLVQKQPIAQQQTTGGATGALDDQSTPPAGPGGKIISSLVDNVRAKLPENPFTKLMSSSVNYFALNNLRPLSNYYIKPALSSSAGSTSNSTSTLSPLIGLESLKDPLDSAESSVFSAPADALNSITDPLTSAQLTAATSPISDNGIMYKPAKIQQQQSTTSSLGNKWLRPNSIMSNFVQGSLKDFLTLTQLPVGGASGGASSLSSSLLPASSLATKKLSTAPSVLESNSKHKLSTQEMALGSRIIEELLRFAYILSSGVKTKRDPYVALANSPLYQSSSSNPSSSFSQRSTNPQQASGQTSSDSKPGGGQLAQKIRDVLATYASSSPLFGPVSDLAVNKAKPRGIMWEMATDPSLAVTVFHLLERASFAVPLGFLLLPFVKAIRSPFGGGGLDFGRFLPPRASHRSVELEELAKRLDLVDKMLSRALRPTHRDATFVG